MKEADMLRARERKQNRNQNAGELLVILSLVQEADVLFSSDTNYEILLLKMSCYDLKK